MLLNFTKGPIDDGKELPDVYELNLSPDEEFEFMELVMKYTDKKGGTSQQLVNQAIVIVLQLLSAMPDLLSAHAEKRNKQHPPKIVDNNNCHLHDPSSTQINIGEEDDEYVDD